MRVFFLQLKKDFYIKVGGLIREQWQSRALRNCGPKQELGTERKE
jgi:hypothetical protein